MGVSNGDGFVELWESVRDERLRPDHCQLVILKVAYHITQVVRWLDQTILDALAKPFYVFPYHDESGAGNITRFIIQYSFDVSAAFSDDVLQHGPVREK